MESSRFRRRVAVSLALGASVSRGCTNLIVTPGASVNGSTIYSYAADSAGLYGTLGRYQAKKNIPAGTTKVIYDWDSGMYLGDIPEPSETYDVVGNMNEFQLTIGETTFGGVPSLCKGQKGSVMDYGNLIWTTLQRAKTVQEAIQVMAGLVEKHGYVSEGESFTLADPTEVWVLELIGKGDLVEGEKGAVWVAKKIPDGHVAAHANQARITEFDMKDSETTRFAPDVVDFAVKAGLFDPKAGKAFSFSEVYDPISFGGARWSDARVWSYFSQVTSIPDFAKTYEKYVLGEDLSTRMPLSVPVKKKIAVRDMMQYMRNSFENTVLDMSADVGMGPWRARYRDRPLSWTYQGQTYANERSIGTQQTSWHFVAEMRGWLPADVGGVFWFGVDDARFSVHVPFYAHVKIPKSLANPGSNGAKGQDDENLLMGVENEDIFDDADEHDDLGSILDGQLGLGLEESSKKSSVDIEHFSFQSLWWINNLVANRVYTQWDVIEPVVTPAVHAFESEFFGKQKKLEEKALEISNPKRRSRFLSRASNQYTKLVLKKWQALWLQLTLQYRDGVKVLSSRPGHDHGGNAMGGAVADVVQGSGLPGENEWPAEWKKRIVEEAGDHFRVRSSRDKKLKKSSSAQDHQLLNSRKALIASGKDYRNTVATGAFLPPRGESSSYLAPDEQVASPTKKGEEANAMAWTALVTEGTAFFSRAWSRLVAPIKGKSVVLDTNADELYS
ncbi:unnamed protein product [Amoebophrya sp. A25]|nr:unnamed protein product [Amoebophrya sp. A25]|eukprot:GSA25T00019999001.1